MHVCKGRCHYHAAFKSWMQSLSACLHAAFLYSTALLLLCACSLNLYLAALGTVSVTGVDGSRPQQSGTAGLVQADGCFSQLPFAMQHLIIYTFKRSKRKRCEWKPYRIVLKSQVRLARLQQVHRVSKALYRTDCFRGAASVLSLTQTFESLHHTVWQRTRASPILSQIFVCCDAIATKTTQCFSTNSSSAPALSEGIAAQMSQACSTYQSK